MSLILCAADEILLDNVWYSQGGTLPNIGNTDEEKAEIKTFVKDMFDKTEAGTIAHPPIADNGDLRTIGYACEVMKRFKPTLTVIYLSNVDSCHGNFTSYLESLHIYSCVGHIWGLDIQNNIPQMSNNTTMMVVPEHGRNLNLNNIEDGNAFLVTIIQMQIVEGFFQVLLGLALTVILLEMKVIRLVI